MAFVSAFTFPLLPPALDRVTDCNIDTNPARLAGKKSPADFSAGLFSVQLIELHFGYGAGNTPEMVRIPLCSITFWVQTQRVYRADAADESFKLNSLGWVQVNSLYIRPQLRYDFDSIRRIFVHIKQQQNGD
jgi:hypothetical protein